MSQERDRGASTIIVVLALPILVFAGALVLDGGRGLVARRETQNAADAAALAKAVDCARGIGTTSLTAYQTNGATLSNSPACGASSTTAQMSKVVDLLFAPGGDTRTVTRSATASWGVLTSATGVFPITIASCALAGVTFGQKVTFRARNFPGSPCPSPSGQFGWTDIDCSAPAVVEVGQGFGIDGTPGNTPKACSNAQLDALIGTDVLVPIWDQSITGCGHTYCLATFALFHLTGWSGNGAANVGSPPSTLRKQCDASADGGVDHKDNTPCIRGYFLKYASQEGGYGTGPCNTSATLNACRVYLSS